MAADRGHWGSRLGFILAAAGSAIGLGNIWGFPTRVGQGGGAAFVLVYLICIFAICTPILIAEIVLGRGAGLSPVAAFQKLRPGTPFRFVAAIGVASGVGILSFYAVIGGWTLAYVVLAVMGRLSSDADQMGGMFNNLASRGGLNIVLTFLFIGLAAWSNVGGVRRGIERASKILMPALLALLALLCVRALTLPGASEGIAYYLKPDVSKALDPSVFSAALGQAFFSLSLGNGLMLTYGSYLSRKESIGRVALWVVALDTLIALVAGLIVFPAGFSIAGFDPGSSGPGLLFTVLPRLFATLPAGNLFGAAFFVLLVLASLTSAISMLEIPVSHCVDAYQWTRRKAVALVAGLTCVLAIPCALGNGAVESLTNFVPQAWGGNYLGFTATLWNNFALPIGGLAIAVFVGHVWGVNAAVKELAANRAWFPGPGLWSALIRYVAPVAILIILVTSVWPILFG